MAERIQWPTVKIICAVRYLQSEVLERGPCDFSLCVERWWAKLGHPSQAALCFGLDDHQPRCWKWAVSTLVLQTRCCINNLASDGLFGGGASMRTWVMAFPNSWTFVLAFLLTIANFCESMTITSWGGSFCGHVQQHICSCRWIVTSGVPMACLIFKLCR